MSEIAVETFRPVRFDVARLHVKDAAEIWLPDMRQVDYPRVVRARLVKELEDLIRMASGKSATASQWVKNHLLGQVAIAAMGNVYFGMWTTTAGTDMDAYVGNTAGEVTGGSYDRAAKVNNTTNFASIVGDAAKVNSNAIAWAAASANWNAGAVIPQLLVLDGNLKTAADNGVVWGDFTVAKSVLSGDTPQINTSSFSYTEE